MSDTVQFDHKTKDIWISAEPADDHFDRLGDLYEPDCDDPSYPGAVCEVVRTTKRYTIIRMNQMGWLSIWGDFDYQADPCDGDPEDRPWRQKFARALATLEREAPEWAADRKRLTQDNRARLKAERAKRQEMAR